MVRPLAGICTLFVRSSGQWWYYYYSRLTPRHATSRRRLFDTFLFLVYVSIHISIVGTYVRIAIYLHVGLYFLKKASSIPTRYLRRKLFKKTLQLDASSIYTSLQAKVQNRALYGIYRYTEGRFVFFLSRVQFVVCWTSLLPISIYDNTISQVCLSVPVSV